MYKDNKEFQTAARELLKLAEAHDRGEVPTHKLLYAWKMFYQQGSEYIERLSKEANSNPNWS